EAKDLLPNSLVVLPVGSIEQHCNAPLGLDAMISEVIAARACLRLESKNIACIILPAVYYGFSLEWMDSPGTITLKPTTLLSLIEDIIASLAEHGAKKIVILNGHGGNSGILEAAARVSSRKYNVVVGVIDYWRVAGLKLGHCDEIEEMLMKDLLGVEQKCECEKMVTIKKYRLAVPELPTKAGAPGSETVPLGELIKRVAEAMEEVYNADTASPGL
ncbi:MAG: creatininase family protein, partial [Desulfurococcales archaeon]|nr:creatininase family protein [Desulfurococcales archaeon]